MQFIEIIELAAVMLQLEDVLKSDVMTRGSQYTLDYSDNVSVTINQLIRCGDLVIKQTAAEFIPLTFCETQQAKSGKIAYENLSKPVIDIVKVQYPQSEANVSFRVFPSYLSVPKCEALQITYTYEPKRYSLDEQIDYEKIPARVFAYGVASEYALISGMYDEAAMWDRRFRDSMRSLALQKREKRIRRRRWS